MTAQPSSSLALVDDSKEYKPVLDARLLTRYSAPKYNIPPAPTARAFNCYPSVESILSNPWVYKDVQITMDDPDVERYLFDLAQDDGGMDVGVGIPEKTLKISPKIRWASQKVNTLLGESVTTIAICKLKMDEPPMNVYTVVQGLPDGMIKAGSALIGRFMVQDVVARTYVGAYADNVEGIVAGSWNNISAPAPFSVVIERFRASALGKRLFAEVVEKTKSGAIMFQAKAFADALASFQWASVFGFFTHSPEEQYVLLKNLASGWEKYLLDLNEFNLTVPLYWALEAQKVQNTSSVQGQIVRIRAAHKE